MPSKPNTKPPRNVSSICFENKGVEFINIARILPDPDIVKSLLTPSVKFLMPNATYTLTPPISTKCNNSHFPDRHHKHIVTDDLPLIKKNVFLKT